MDIFSCCVKAPKTKEEEDSKIDPSKLGQNFRDENEDTAEGKKRKVIQRILFGEEVDELKFSSGGEKNDNNNQKEQEEEQAFDPSKSAVKREKPPPAAKKKQQQELPTEEVQQRDLKENDNDEDDDQSPVKLETAFSPKQDAEENQSRKNDIEKVREEKEAIVKSKPEENEPKQSTTSTTSQSSTKRVINPNGKPNYIKDDDDEDSSDSDNDDGRNQEQQQKQKQTEENKESTKKKPNEEAAATSTNTNNNNKHVDPNASSTQKPSSLTNAAPSHHDHIRPALEESGDPQVTDDASPYLVNEWFAARGVDHPEAVRWCQSAKSIRIRIRPATDGVGYSLTSEQVLEYANDFVPPAVGDKPEAFSDVDEEDEDNKEGESDDDDDDEKDYEDSDAESEISIEEEVTDPATGAKTLIKTKMTMNRKALAKLENGGSTPTNEDRKRRREERKKRKEKQEPKPELPFRVTLMLYAPLAPGSFLFTQSNGYLVLTGTKKKAERWPSLLTGGADKKKNPTTNVLEFGWIAEEAPTPSMMMEDKTSAKAVRSGDSDSDSDDE